MTLYEFLLLNEDQKYDAMSEYGVLVGDRKEGQHGFLLYQLDSFYVEGQFDINENKILSIKSFSSDVPLSPYLDEIDLHNIIP